MLLVPLDILKSLLSFGLSDYFGVEEERRDFSLEEKPNVVNEILGSIVHASELCRNFDISPVKF